MGWGVREDMGWGEDRERCSSPCPCVYNTINWNLSVSLPETSNFGGEIQIWKVWLVGEVPAGFPPTKTLLSIPNFPNQRVGRCFVQAPLDFWSSFRKKPKMNISDLSFPQKEPLQGANFSIIYKRKFYLGGFFNQLKNAGRFGFRLLKDEEFQQFLCLGMFLVSKEKMGFLWWICSEILFQLWIF